MNAIANTANRATWFALGASLTTNVVLLAGVVGWGYILTERDANRDKRRPKDTIS